MKNLVSMGDALDLTAPSGGVVSGSAYKIGVIICVASADAAATATFVGNVKGVYDLPKATGAAWSEGDLLYWDDTAKNFTKTSTSNTKAGYAVAAAASGDTTGRLRLVASI